MGFYFRQSTKLGPMKCNLSKSGIRVSGKGARVRAYEKGHASLTVINDFYIAKRK